MSDKQIPNLPAATALNGSEQYEAVQAGTSTRVTTDQIAQYTNATYPPPGVSAVNATSPLTSNTAGSVVTIALPSQSITNSYLALMAAGTVKANITVGSSTPSDVPVGNVLDVIGSTHGDLLYRGSTSWTALPASTNYDILTANGPTTDPSYRSIDTILDHFAGSSQGSIFYRGASGWTSITPGTAGQVLKTNGAGADPSWISTGTGTVTQVNTGTGLTGGPITTTGTISIANTGVTAATYGSASLVPVMTVNAQGQITSVTNTNIDGVSLTTGTISTAPSAATDIANKNYVDSVINGLNAQIPCNYATVVPLTATYNNGSSGVGATLTATSSGVLSIDGSNPTVGQRILVKNQTTTTQNGAYVVTNAGSVSTAYVLTRATDYDQTAEINAGDGFYIISGSTNGNTTWVEQTAAPVVIGTTAITFIQFGGALKQPYIANKAVYASSTTTLTLGTLPVFGGGTGVSATPTNGQLLIGNGTGYTLSTLTGGTGVSVTNGAGSVTVGLSNTAVTAASYGSQSSVGTFTVNAQGQLTAAASVPINAVSLTTGTISTNPTNATDIANKDYVDSVAAGLNFHAACNYATTADLGTVTYNNGSSGIGATLTKTTPFATLSIDGASPSVGQRILVKNQVTASQNGIYTVTSVGSGSVGWVLTRATDYDSSGTGTNEIDQGDFVLVLSGTANANTSWVQQTPLPITVGSTAITFIQFGGSGTAYSAGTGLSLVGTQFSIANTTVTATSYGSASSVGTFTVNAQGQLTAAATTAIAINGNQITSGSVGPTFGGTGVTTYATGDLLYASATNTLAKLAATTNGYLLTLAGGVPTWAAPPSTGVTTISFGSTGLTPNTATSGAVTVGGTLVAANGGTGVSSYAIGDLLYASGTTTLSKLADVATGSVLVSGGVGVAPAYSSTPTVTSITAPTHLGGTAASSSLTLQSTSGVGTTDSIVMKVGNNGATTAVSIATTGIVSFPTTGAIVLPASTTANRPTGQTGMLRFNTTTTAFEGYNGSAWGSIGGGATGGGTDQIFYLNGQTVTTSYSIPSGQNAGTFGPVTVNSGATVTVPSGSTWSIV